MSRHTTRSSSTFADGFTDDMERVVSVFDNIDSTRSLTRWAAANNLLHHMEKTCHYLAATGDTDTLTAYVSTLRDHFHSDSRWTFFNRKLVEVAGAWWRPHAA